MKSKMWNRIGDMLGETIFHPQYAAKRGEYFAVTYLRKHARGVFLDIGCGRQPHRSVLAPAVTRYVGLDLPKNIGYYQSPYPVEIAADAGNIPLPDSSIDTVMMLWVVEHLEDPDVAFSQIRRVLAPGGLLVIYFVENYPAHGFPPNYRRYTPFGMKRLLIHNGFTPAKIISFGTVWETMVIYQNVWLMELVKHSGILLLPLVAPLIIAGNCAAFVLSRILPYGYPIGHVAIARRKRAV